MGGGVAVVGGECDGVGLVAAQDDECSQNFPQRQVALNLAFS
jgi:hypothetical protein